jgi:hypothetical protein
MEENTNILKVTKRCKLLSTIVKTNTIVIDIKNVLARKNLNKIKTC